MEPPHFSNDLFRRSPNCDRSTRSSARGGAIGGRGRRLAVSGAGEPARDGGRPLPGRAAGDAGIAAGGAHLPARRRRHGPTTELGRRRRQVLPGPHHRLRVGLMALSSYGLMARAFQ